MRRLAPTIWALIGARVLQGFGGGGLLPLGQTVIADLLSPRERPLIQSYSSAMFLAASILALNDKALAKRLEAWRTKQTAAVAQTPKDGA